MTTSRVLDKDEISLNAVRFHTTGRVSQSLVAGASERPLVWEPTFRGGIGKNKVRFNERSDQAWWSTCQLRYDHQIVPRQLETTTATSGVTGTIDIGAIGTLANEVYVAFGTSIRKYNNDTDAWSSQLAALPADATDAITIRLNNVTYLVFAHTGGYSYSSNGSSWTDVNDQDAVYLSFWDNRLWGIDSTGQLWFSYNIGEESNDAQLPLPNDSATDLYIARNSEGQLVLFVGTVRGPYEHDNDFTRFRFTDLELPEHPDNGKGSTRWRDSTYIPSGLAVYRHIQGANSAIVTVMGPDRDDGLPSDYRGVIRQILGTHNDLLVVLDSTRRAPTVDTFVTSGLASHRGAVIDPNVGFSSILGWNEEAWETKYLSGSAARALTYAHVSNAYSEYRLWFALGGEILYLPLQREIQNPDEIADFTYVASSELITPWLEADKDKDATGVYVRVGAREMTSNETITVDFAVNDSSSWTSLGVITSDGTTEYLLPNSTAPTGISFLNFRMRFTLARGSTVTNKPILSPPVFAFRYKDPAKYRYTVELDLQSPYKDQTPKQLRDQLRTAIESSSFVPFSYRNDSGSDFGSSDRRFYVDVVGATNLEETGEDERGLSLVTMLEV
jgi:hypothetical protein